MNINKKKIAFLIGLTVLGYLLYNALNIYHYSFEYAEDNSDVAIVLGAATYNGKLSPVFRERINHSIYLYKKGLVKKVIFTGGYGEGQKYADSEVAYTYAVAQGIPEHDMVIEKKSTITFENLKESKYVMDSLGLRTVLLVSDPLHMKRSIAIAKRLKIDCKPSPTKTTMYRSSIPKLKSLIYETFFYSIGKIARMN